jgi:hypothetical protein
MGWKSIPLSFHMTSATSLANIAFANESWAWVAISFGVGALLVLFLTYRNSPLRGGAKVAAMALKAMGLILLALALIEPVHLDEVPKKNANDVAILADNSAGLAVPLGHGKEAPSTALRAALVGPAPDQPPGWIGGIGDTFRGKGENVSTTEVAEVIASVPGIFEVNVYGVEVKGFGGRAGMASLVVDEHRFDPARMREVVHAGLPGYARPLFLRLTQAMETTGTFKQKKADAIREGFDPRTVGDVLMFDDPRQKLYVPLSDAVYDEIISGALRL